MSSNFIKDAIYGVIEIPEEYRFIYELLNTKEMKRLMKVNQLGECFNVFFNANHSRYSHSLGVFRNALKIANSLNINIPEQDKKIIVAAALLHDIGHGPRSHSFEHIANHDHEKMTKQIILSDSTEVNNVLTKNNINPEEVVSIIDHKHKNKYYWQIVTSQIDADRLDYLMRDSFFTGANYGVIDLNTLICWMKVIDNQIVFDFKSIGLIEDVLFSRAQMFKQVYINKKVVAYELLLNLMFERYYELYHQGFEFKNKYNLYYLLNPYVKKQEYDIETFLEFNDEKMNLIIESWFNEDDAILKEYATNYIYKNNYFCSDTKLENYELINQQEYSFTFYDPRKKIIIDLGNELKEITKIDNYIHLITDEKKMNYKLYFYKNK